MTLAYTELSFSDYHAFLILGAALFALIAVWVHQKAGVRGLWSTVAIAASVLIGLGYLDWQNQSIRESPLIGYVLCAIASTVASAGCICGLRRRPIGLQWGLASVCFYFSVLGTAFVSYFLRDVLPI